MTGDDPLHAQGADTAGKVPGGVRHPPWLLAAGGAIAAAALIVTLLGMLLYRGQRFTFDTAILLAARGGRSDGVPVGPDWMASAAVDVTTLGGGTVLTLVVVLTVGFLAISRLWLTAALVLGGTISGSVAVSVAKMLVGRPRPAVTDHLVAVSSASFPSGHAANSAIVYLTIATLIVQIVPGAGPRRYILLVGALLVTAIGMSRVYLGVHWPSDVLGGWAFGTLWAIAWWAIGAWARLKRAGRSILRQP